MDEPDPVILPIEDSLDLHAFSPRDVTSVVDEYLRQAAALGYGEVRLIHGRGIGVQRAAVQALLGRHPLVASFFDAPPERGGWGATIAILKRERHGSSARSSRREHSLLRRGVSPCRLGAGGDGS